VKFLPPYKIAVWLDCGGVKVALEKGFEPLGSGDHQFKTGILVHLANVFHPYFQVYYLVNGIIIHISTLTIL